MSRLHERMKNPRWWLAGMVAAPGYLIGIPLVMVGTVGDWIMKTTNNLVIRIERGRP